MDLSNQIIETVIKPIGVKGTKTTFYICKCTTEQCPRSATIRKYDFKKWSGFCKKCADKIKLDKARKIWSGTNLREYEALYNRFVALAQRKNLSNSISYEDFVKFTENPYCSYCYTYVNFAKFHLGKNGWGYNLDRTDNSLGYSVDNCVVCCWKCNNSKSNRYSEEEWRVMNVSFRQKFHLVRRQYDLWDNDFYD